MSLKQSKLAYINIFHPPKMNMILMVLLDLAISVAFFSFMRQISCVYKWNFIFNTHHQKKIKDLSVFVCDQTMSFPGRILKIIPWVWEEADLLILDMSRYPNCICHLWHLRIKAKLHWIRNFRVFKSTYFCLKNGILL